MKHLKTLHNYNYTRMVGFLWYHLRFVLLADEKRLVPLMEAENSELVLLGSTASRGLTKVTRYYLQPVVRRQPTLIT